MVLLAACFTLRGHDTLIDFLCFFFSREDDLHGIAFSVTSLEP